MPLCLTCVHSVARVPPVQQNSTDPDVKAMFDNARSRGGKVINLSLIRANAPKLAKAGSNLAYAICRPGARLGLLYDAVQAVEQFLEVVTGRRQEEYFHTV